MKRTFLIAGFGSLMSLCAMAESWTGVISDSRCGAKHAAGSAADVACMKTCMNKGATPVLVTSAKVFNIASASNDQMTQYLGKKVTLTGKVEKDYSGEFITVDSIKKAE